MRLTTRQLKRLIAEEARKVMNEDAIPPITITVNAIAAQIARDAIQKKLNSFEENDKNSVKSLLGALSDALGVDDEPKAMTIRGVAPQGAGGHAPPRMSERRVRRRGRY